MKAMNRCASDMLPGCNVDFDRGGVVPPCLRSSENYVDVSLRLFNRTFDAMRVLKQVMTEEPAQQVRIFRLDTYSTFIRSRSRWLFDHVASVCDFDFHCAAL